jgi:uncharacterized protein (TIGR03083 family)
MVLTRTEVSAGLLQELAEFEELIRSLDDEQWRSSTRCEGWTVADIAAHVIGTLSEIAAGRTDGLGRPEINQRIVEERRGRSSTELADELAQARSFATQMLDAFDDDAWRGPAPGDVAPTLGDGVATLWYDAYVHNEDIRHALTIPPKRGPGLRVSLAHLTDALERDGWGPAVVAADGFGEFRIGSGGANITADPLEFVLAATGRADPALLGLDETVNVYRPR